VAGGRRARRTRRCGVKSCSVPAPPMAWCRPRPTRRPSQR